ncbi:ChuX/HutX family heme-like substrate-binding protein [Devosia sp. YIM 151766]|uniref:hemin-degrading factor n=1 Tax=Devosia sp. YIM 151766 TaxID=3017325 RepID=UPI00255CD81D|nr:ChuX/HutX family heme-like substrate-binding protein [Devosia sp. YIM 151766]WIY52926.1 ChuX/HutX family heme-like substrate-binding protein [Devosia sp. YIM 151766]
MSSKSAAEIRDLRQTNPTMRARDLARIHGFSEAELVAAQVGADIVAIKPDVSALLNGLAGAGEIMALTRNESCVSEKIGPVERVEISPHAAMVIGEQIDLRIFPRHWQHGFAIERHDDKGKVHRSMQFFDAQGNAVHKVHARPRTDLAAWAGIAGQLTLPEQADTIAVQPAAAKAEFADKVDEALLRQRWQGMTDTHQVFGLLRELRISRLQALQALGPELAWELDHSAVETLFNRAAIEAVPLLVFVANQGCTQIHGGPIKTIKMMGPWLNVMEPNFHMHLRLDQISCAWAVRKPTQDGVLTSIELFDEAGDPILQMFGRRGRGQAERDDWRMLAEKLPLKLERSA